MTFAAITLTMLWVICLSFWSLMLGKEIFSKRSDKLYIVIYTILIILFFLNILAQLLATVGLRSID